MKNEEYTPDIDRQDQIAIDERKKEREERREEKNSPTEEFQYPIKRDLNNWVISSTIPCHLSEHCYKPDGHKPSCAKWGGE